VVIKKIVTLRTFGSKMTAIGNEWEIDQNNINHFIQIGHDAEKKWDYRDYR